MWTRAACLQRTASFPTSGIAAKPAWPDDLLFRRFDVLAEDREVDFTANRPQLETRLLQCCTRDTDGNPLGEDFFWSLEVGIRVQCLLIIAALDGPDQDLDIDLRCLQPDCGEEMEVSLSLKDIAGLREIGGADAPIQVNAHDRNFTLRRPTGKDQQQWLNQGFTDPKMAVWSMAQTLIIDNDQDTPGRLDSQNGSDLIRTINDALEAADPLVNFAVRTQCPGCGALDAHHVDLGALALGKLQIAQNRLLTSIHTLALRYHWSEEQIMALPSWRRDYYLALIERETCK
jgi:hypothetical protein